MIRRWFTFRPSNAFVQHWRTSRRECYSAGEWAAAWQWFVQRLVLDKPSRSESHGTPYEWINGTSSIHNSSPYPLPRDEYSPSVHGGAKERLRQLLQHVGGTCGRAAFLRRACGLRSWQSLDRPLTIPVQTSSEFPRDEWFDLTGRTFRKSPNSCHKKATWVQGSSLELSHDGKLWSLKIEYGYRHDSSSWFQNIRQLGVERLDTFAARVDTELDAALAPDDNRERDYKERKFQKVYGALETLFYDRGMHRPFWETPLAETITTIDGSSLVDSRIELTARRLNTLRRWTRETVRDAKERKVKAEEIEDHTLLGNTTRLARSRRRTR